MTVLITCQAGNRSFLFSAIWNSIISWHILLHFKGESFWTSCTTVTYCKYWVVCNAWIFDLYIQAVRNGDLKIIPSMHEKVWYNWLENCRLVTFSVAFSNLDERVKTMMNTILRRWCCNLRQTVVCGNRLPSVLNHTTWLKTRALSDPHHEIE